ncbi:unnamed protein product [Phytophthora fragariaefolia]|uniref:Unnamed protein product n=1 Tax=Phytophthora fragariaefolia TaxID=1490495 RepID=A0A9W6UCC7_9STRA|nr:unnamed protein product [Phytophthora fragariaefolia]
MRCSSVGCTLVDVDVTAPCCICGKPVHHVCSNDISGDEEPSKRYGGCIFGSFGLLNLTQSVYRFWSPICLLNYRSSNTTKSESTPVSSQGVAPSEETMEMSDMELRLLQGEEVSEQTEQAMEEANVVRDADAVVDRWLALRVNWAGVAEQQYTK